MIVYLSKEEVIIVQQDMLLLGGLPGIRSYQLLESAISMPMWDFFETVPDKAAAYLFYLASNHPFNDANKRTAGACAELFLRLNGLHLKMDTTMYENLIVDVADRKASKRLVMDLFAKHTCKAVLH